MEHKEEIHIFYKSILNNNSMRISCVFAHCVQSRNGVNTKYWDEIRRGSFVACMCPIHVFQASREISLSARRAWNNLPRRASDFLSLPDLQRHNRPLPRDVHPNGNFPLKQKRMGILCKLELKKCQCCGINLGMLSFIGF